MMSSNSLVRTIIHRSVRFFLQRWSGTRDAAQSNVSLQTVLIKVDRSTFVAFTVTGNTTHNSELLRIFFSVKNVFLISCS